MTINDPVLLWKLDEGGSATTASDTGSVGTNSGTWGSTHSYVTGKIGAFAGHFSGAATAYIEKASASGLPAVNAANSVAFWMRPTATNTDTVPAIISNQSSAGAEALINSGSYFKIQTWGGTDYLSYTTTFTTNTWYHICWTYNGSGSWILYINGSQVATATSTAQTGSTTFVDLGQYQASAGEQEFIGDIDDFRIYSRVLSSADVTELFNYTGASETITMDKWFQPLSYMRPRTEMVGY